MIDESAALDLAEAPGWYRSEISMGASPGPFATRSPVESLTASIQVADVLAGLCGNSEVIGATHRLHWGLLDNPWQISMRPSWIATPYRHEEGRRLQQHCDYALGVTSLVEAFAAVDLREMSSLNLLVYLDIVSKDPVTRADSLWVAAFLGFHGFGEAFGVSYLEAAEGADNLVLGLPENSSLQSTYETAQGVMGLF